MPTARWRAAATSARGAWIESLACEACQAVALGILPAATRVDTRAALRAAPTLQRRAGPFVVDETPDAERIGVAQLRRQARLAHLVVTLELGEAADCGGEPHRRENGMARGRGPGARDHRPAHPGPRPDPPAVHAAQPLA